MFRYNPKTAVAQGRRSIARDGAATGNKETTLPPLPRIQDQTHELYAEFLEPIGVAVVHPCDEVSFEAALNARDAGLIDPILIGPRAKLEAMLVKQLEYLGSASSAGIVLGAKLNERSAALEHDLVKEME